MDRDRVIHAMYQGVSFVCATCENFHKGIDMGYDGCKKVIAPKTCAGPMKKMNFPEYNGVIPRETIHKYCFVCGAESTGMVFIKNDPNGHVTGVCDDHKHMLSSYSVGNEPPPFVTKSVTPIIQTK